MVVDDAHVDVNVKMLERKGGNDRTRYYVVWMAVVVAGGSVPWLRATVYESRKAPFSRKGKKKKSSVYPGPGAAHVPERCMTSSFLIALACLKSTRAWKEVRGYWEKD